MSEKILGVQCQNCKKVIPLTTDGRVHCPECGALMVWGFIYSVERLKGGDNERR